MKKLKQFIAGNISLIEFIVGIIFGITIVIVEVCTPPITIATIVLGGLIALVGAIGLVLELTAKGKFKN